MATFIIVSLFLLKESYAVGRVSVDKTDKSLVKLYLDLRTLYLDSEDQRGASAFDFSDCSHAAD